MIQFKPQHISINRIIVHKILQQEVTQEYSEVELEKNVIKINEKGKDILIARVIDALGKESKSFELNVESDSEGSFFSLAKRLEKLNEEQFILNSQEIAKLLGYSQDRVGLPGGYLLIIDAFDAYNNSPLVLVIKAEGHAVLQHETGTSSLNVLENVFLSPAQKLFKIGVLGFNSYNTSKEPEKNDCYALLFDAQFRDGKPAEYFYKSFLGFSVDQNSKINTYMFYEETVSFINAQMSDPSDRANFLSFLKAYLSPLKADKLIDRVAFIKSTNLSDTLISAYINKTNESFPRSFFMDTSLINNSLSKRRMCFSNDINIVGPEENFEERVKLISKREDFDKIDIDNPEITILVIEGKQK